MSTAAHRKAKSYLVEHGIEQAIKTAVATILQDQPAEPLKVLGELLITASAKPAAQLDPKKEFPKPGPMKDTPFPAPTQEKPMAIYEDACTHHDILVKEDDCVIYQSLFSKGGTYSPIHYHDFFTCYISVGDPRVTILGSTTDFYACTKETIGDRAFSMQLPPTPAGGLCNCVAFPMMFPPPIGKTDCYFHRVGLVEDCDPEHPFQQIGVEVKKWPAAATADALPKPTGWPGPFKIMTHQPPGSKEPVEAKQKVFTPWQLKMEPGDEVATCSIPFPCALVCSFAAAELEVGKDSPICGFEKGSVKWMPTGCADLGAIKYPKSATGPFLLSVIEFVKEGFA